MNRHNTDEHVTITHYAPDVTVTSIDYYPPVPFEERFRRAKKAIDEFLSKASPDELSGFYFDEYIDKDEKALISILREQITGHDDTHAKLAKKHEAELSRLRAEIDYVREEIKRLSAEILNAENLYNENNQEGKI